MLEFKTVDFIFFIFLSYFIIFFLFLLFSDLGLEISMMSHVTVKNCHITWIGVTHQLQVT